MGIAPGWVPADTVISVAGLLLPGPLYVARELPAVSGDGVEPALIDPWLPVDLAAPDWQAAGLDYWPTYATITPGQRAAYLRWLAGGRRHHDVSIGYPFLFLYGLERRVLHEWPHDQSSQAEELPLVRAEVDRLLGLFGANASFAGYATGFRQVLDLMSADEPAEPPPDGPLLRLGLSRFAMQRRPLPAAWALTWVLARPDHLPWTITRRCAAEFTELFRRRYAGGLLVRPEGPDLPLGYRPASPGFHGLPPLTLRGVPDVFGQPDTLRALTGLAEECAGELEAYDRFLRREPEAQGGLAAAALLPADLLDPPPAVAAPLLEWGRSRLGGFKAVTVPAEELLAHLPADRRGKRDVITLAQLLGRIDVGIEPDPRFGGPVPAGEPLVLFRMAEPVSLSPSEAYRAAMLLLHLGAAVSAADGYVSVEEKELLAGHLEHSLDLSGAERTRLRAHLRWLLATEVELTGLNRRIAVLDEARREHIAGFLAEVAAADGRIDPAEVRALRQIRTMLGLDPDQVPRADPTPVRLDEAALASRLREAAEVSALLGEVFADEPEPPPSPAETVGDAVAGLDLAHSTLLRALAGRGTITRAEWEALAGTFRLLPDGALDRLNEAGYEAAGEPIAEGDDPIEINTYALEAML